MKNTFKRNLLIGFGLSILLLAISAAASFVSIRNLLYNNQQVAHTNEVITELETAISTLKDAETGLRGFLLTGVERFLEPYTGAYQRALLNVESVEKLTGDNPDQQQDGDHLKEVVAKRLAVLDDLIEQKRLGTQPSLESLERGKFYMDSARSLVRSMERREQLLLQSRTGQLNKFAASTPLLIIITSVLSLLVTCVFFFRVNSDFARRTGLQKALLQKDEDISRRIAIIQEIAGKIAGGDFKVRVEDEGEDGLGGVSVALNKMAGSLDKSFSLLSEKEWMQSGVAGLNAALIGDQDVAAITSASIRFLANYTGAQVGAFYMKEDDGALNFSAGYALSEEAGQRRLAASEGIAGQVGAAGKEVTVPNIGAAQVVLRFAAGEVVPQTIFALPVVFEKEVKGVIELASAGTFPPDRMEYLRTAAAIIGVAINTAQARQRVQQLLNETQAQSEELQAQHAEMENINAELEAQAEKLQASEEELKVQQEELLEANSELEERSRLLEERNQVIVERNIEIQRKAEDLAQSTKYKSEFLANMSHELRTPLNSVLLLSRLLAENGEDNLSTDQVEYAKVIQSSGQGLLSLIDEILDLSKIEAGKMDLEYAAEPVAAIAEDLRRLFAPVAADRNLAFKVTIANGVPPQIETDKMRLQQVLKNLLSNALKFTAQGTVSLYIGVDEAAADTLTFAVSDTGIGIAPEKQESIFEAFQQADGSTRRQFGGTGLGLSISRELSKLLGGTITIKSEPGKGSTFTLHLPVSKAAQQPVSLPAPASPLPKKPEAANLRTTFIPEALPDDRAIIQPGDKAILIIEDDTAFAKALIDYTRQKGYKALQAVRGDEGIELAKTHKPVGILLDLQLPVRDGWEVMEELKSDPATRHIPVHIMSSEEAKKESLVKGAVDFINKPVAFEQMQAVFKKIEQVLNKENKKVLIVEENPQHAKALAHYLETYNIAAQVSGTVQNGVEALQTEGVDCVILDMGIPDQQAYDTLDELKKIPGMESLPIIIFTGKNLSQPEEQRIRKYADSIVIKTAHSYQRILDEVSLFLHLVEEGAGTQRSFRYKRLGALNEVLTGKKILITDDDVRNIFSLTKALEAHNMQVFTAGDGKEAMQTLADHRDMHVVLMDIMMPTMDGYEAMQAIRKKQAFRSLPIIAVTAKAMTGDRARCIQAGASDYISKPVDIDQLLSLLRVWLYDKSI